MHTHQRWALSAFSTRSRHEHFHESTTPGCYSLWYLGVEGHSYEALGANRMRSISASNRADMACLENWEASASLFSRTAKHTLPGPREAQCIRTCPK